MLSKQRQRPLLFVAATLLMLSTFFTLTSILAYGDDPTSSAPVIINEIEINAPGSDGSIWIELLNTGDSPVSLSTLNLKITNGKDGGNVTHVLLKPDNNNSNLTLPAHSNHAISVPITLDFSNLISLYLFEDKVLLDEVEWLNDNIADDRTWQRFPDGVDTGYFEDWVFADSTKGKDNGNLGKAIAECYLNPLCMTLNVPLHKSRGINVNGTVFTIDTFTTSQFIALDLDQGEKKLLVKLSKSGRDSNLSFIHITFPKTLLSGNFLVNTDQTESQHPFFAVANDTHSRLIIEYEPGDRTIEIVGTNVVPEFGSASILLVMAAINCALILEWRRFLATRRSRLVSP